MSISWRKPGDPGPLLPHSGWRVDRSRCRAAGCGPLTGPRPARRPRSGNCRREPTSANDRRRCGLFDCRVSGGRPARGAGPRRPVTPAGRRRGSPMRCCGSGRRRVRGLAVSSSKRLDIDRAQPEAEESLAASRPPADHAGFPRSCRSTVVRRVAGTHTLGGATGRIERPAGGRCPGVTTGRAETSRRRSRPRGRRRVRGGGRWRG